MNRRRVLQLLGGFALSLWLAAAAGCDGHAHVIFDDDADVRCPACGHLNHYSGDFRPGQTYTFTCRKCGHQWQVKW